VESFDLNHPIPLRVLLLGASGTIGIATARALVDRGYHVTSVVRPPSVNSTFKIAVLQKQLSGTEIRWCVASDATALRQDCFATDSFDAVISCMASRTGLPKDAWLVDYEAHSKALQIAKECGVAHFVLLSAICVQKPLLEFQHAKLAFEQELIASGLTYSIVRPTAFFKSLSGQIQRVKAGKPFLIFGDGKHTACKPISDHDLGDFLASCLEDASRHNRILPIGGPGPAITPYEQGAYLFQLLGKTPRFKSVPLGMLSFLAKVLEGVGKIIPSLATKAELARIGHYYASESMLVWDFEKQRYDADATPSYGSQTLFDAYKHWVKEESIPERGDHAVF
jgi:divinyl chlorophyllide a 8-vinyl-reductase